MTSLEKLERTQRFAGRIITGQLKTTPSECVLLEANLRTVSSKCRQNAVIAFDKAQRLNETNPRRNAI